MDPKAPGVGAPGAAGVADGNKEFPPGRNRLLLPIADAIPGLFAKRLGEG